MPSTGPDVRAASAVRYCSDHPAGELLLGGADRAAGRAVQLDGEVGDPAGGDVGGDVHLAAPHDAEVDDALPCGGVEAGVGGRQTRLLECVHQDAQRLALVDPPEELPDRPEVLDVVDQRRSGERHEQRPRRAGPDALGHGEDVPRALGRRVLDEVRLVDDHAAEAQLAQPAPVAVEHLVVDDDDVGETVDGVAVALDRGRRAVRDPAGGLTEPVGLDDVGDDDQERVGVGRLGGEKGLGRLAQTRLVREQERPVAGRGRRDQPRLVRHQLLALGGEPGRRCREAHARRGRPTGALERAQQRAEQLPAGQAARTGPDRSGRGEVRCEEGVRQLTGGHGQRHDPALSGGAVRGLGRASPPRAAPRPRRRGAGPA